MKYLLIKTDGQCITLDNLCDVSGIGVIFTPLPLDFGSSSKYYYSKLLNNNDETTEYNPVATGICYNNPSDFNFITGSIILRRKDLQFFNHREIEKIKNRAVSKENLIKVNTDRFIAIIAIITVLIILYTF